MFLWNLEILEGAHFQMSKYIYMPGVPSVSVLIPSSGISQKSWIGLDNQKLPCNTGGIIPPLFSIDPYKNMLSWVFNEAHRHGQNRALFGIEFVYHIESRQYVRPVYHNRYIRWILPGNHCAMNNEQ